MGSSQIWCGTELRLLCPGVLPVMRVCIKHRQITTTGECQSGAPPALHAALRNSPVERSARSEAAKECRRKRGEGRRREKRREKRQARVHQNRKAMIATPRFVSAAPLVFSVSNEPVSPQFPEEWVSDDHLDARAELESGSPRSPALAAGNDRRAAKPFPTRLPSRAFLTVRTRRFLTSWRRTTGWTGSNEVG